MKNSLPEAFPSAAPAGRITRYSYCFNSFTHFISQHYKKAGLFLIAALSFVNMIGQAGKSHKKEDFDIRRFRVKTIDIARPETRLVLKNIQGITIVDARADTANAGLMQKKTVDPVSGLLNGAENSQTVQRVNKRPIFIALTSGVKQTATSFAAQALVFPNDTDITRPGILMVIKKLWLSDELNFKDQGYMQNKLVGPANRDVWSSGIDIKIEFYLKNGDAYYPMYRYDSIISKALTISEYGQEYVGLALELSMQKLLQMDAKVEALLNKKSFGLADINLRNEEEFNLPALKDSMLNKGVYLTFDDFKNNRPSHEKFELKKDRYSDVVYLRESNGTEYVARNIWGYCDGRNAYVRSADNFFLLQRNSNAFYIFGAKTLKRTEVSTTNTAGYANSSASFYAPVNYTAMRTGVQLEPFQLDWSNGKLY